MKKFLFLMASVFGLAGAYAQPSPRTPEKIQKLKDEVVREVEKQYTLGQQINDMLFSFAELGFQEYETQAYLTQLLEKNGFKTQKGIANVPTAWIATWGSGKPVIALGSDIDCIPKASQKPGIAYADPIVVGAPGHGEGHNSSLKLDTIGLPVDAKPVMISGVPMIPIMGGTDDIADISWSLPTIVLRYPSNIPGLPGHHWSNAISMATPIAHKGINAGAKAEGMTLIDLLLSPDLIKQSWDYYKNEQTKEIQYTPLIGAKDVPAVYLNKGIMEQFKPQLQKTYYNPAKYKTYMEQLGIVYPTVRQDQREAVGK